MNIVFRMDDICTYDELDEKVFHLFLKYEIPLTLGVIPFPEKTGKYLIDSCLFAGVEKELFEIALHGFNHKAHSKVGKYLFSEFCKRPLEEQISMIAKGKELVNET